MTISLLPMPGNEAMATAIAGQLGAEVITPHIRKFPDGETYLRIDADLRQKEVAIVDTLAHPDPKVLPLVFAAGAARDLGALRVGLVAPYLAYMRQDKRFHVGEAIASRSFAKLISASVDWLVTVDPHLHRYRSLSEIYAIPSKIIHSAPLIATWVLSNVKNPFIIGPDVESGQWVSDVSKRIDAPCATLEKHRTDDRDVVVRLPDHVILEGRTPVLMDDIVSSGQTMLEALKIVTRLSPSRPVCIAVHGLFAGGAYEKLQATGAVVITTNSVAHESNSLDISGLLARAVVEFTAGQ